MLGQPADDGYSRVTMDDRVKKDDRVTKDDGVSATGME